MDYRDLKWPQKRENANSVFTVVFPVVFFFSNPVIPVGNFFALREISELFYALFFGALCVFFAFLRFLQETNRPMGVGE